MILRAGQKFGFVFAAADADELLDLIVVGSNVGVVDGPGDFVSVESGFLEVGLGVAETDAAPDICFATTAPDAGEFEVLFVGGDVGLLFL